MQITKFVHSCLLVETPERTVLFDPGAFSKEALMVDGLVRLNDIFITHEHFDHCDIDLIKQLVAKFPEVRITTNPGVVAYLSTHDIQASEQLSEGVVFFESPHEALHGGTAGPDQRGFHYLDMLSHPGDSHSFHETKPILALPFTAPWGSNVRAFDLALELKPQHVLPIHDWHWRDEARRSMYDMFEAELAKQGITFHKLETGHPVEIHLD